MERTVTPYPFDKGFIGERDLTFTEQAGLRDLLHRKPGTLFHHTSRSFPPTLDAFWLHHDFLSQRRARWHFVLESVVTGENRVQHPFSCSVSFDSALDTH
jgi:hypothetical protein